MSLYVYGLDIGLGLCMCAMDPSGQSIIFYFLSQQAYAQQFFLNNMTYVFIITHS